MLPRVKTIAYSVLALSLSSLWAQNGDISFAPSEVKLGTLSQGDTKAVQVEVQNQGAKDIVISTCIPQGRGPQELKCPEKIPAKGKAKLSFLYNSATLKGNIFEFISLLDTASQQYTLKLTGNIHVPVEIYPPLADFGSFKSTAPQAQVVYAFSPDKKDFDLKLKAGQKDFYQVKISPAKLDLSKMPEKITEDGSIPGYKIEVSLLPNKVPSHLKSLHDIVSFSSSQWPKATPEIYLIGYNK